MFAIYDRQRFDWLDSNHGIQDRSSINKSIHKRAKFWLRVIRAVGNCISSSIPRIGTVSACGLRRMID
jgi:hypothetical protein